MDKLMKQVEKMDSEEIDKLRKLLNEKKKSDKGSSSSKPDDKTDMTWMYKQDKPDRDEYLLGRSIDKHIEDEGKVEEDKNAPGASFAEVIARRADIDMQAKIREDPLYAIRKQEEESRKKLLTNPVRMKQLERLIKEKEKQSAKKKQKKKKRRSTPSSSSSSSSSDSDSGDELLNKYLEIRKQKEMKALRRSGGGGDYNADESRKSKDKSRDTHDKHVTSSHRHDRDTRDRDRHDRDARDHERRDRHRDRDHESPKRRRRDSSHSNDESERHYSQKHNRHHDHGHSGDRAYGLISASKESKSSRSKHGHSERGSRDSAKSHSRRSKSRSRSRSPLRRDNKNDKRTSSRDDRHHHSSRRSRTPPRKEQKSKKLSADEMARRRAEMLNNAKWRDEQREESVKRHKQEAARERDEYEKQGGPADFINPMMMKHASNLSVEERIKRNKYNVQRTTADLDKNFTKR